MDEQTRSGDDIPVIPREITRAGDHDIRILWKSGHESLYPARYLRLKCPCAVCVDEWTGREILSPQAVTEDVAPSSLELVGRYGLRVRWTDGHSDGIYTFKLLRELCPCCQTSD